MIIIRETHFRSTIEAAPKAIAECTEKVGDIRGEIRRQAAATATATKRRQGPKRHASGSPTVALYASLYVLAM